MKYMGNAHFRYDFYNFDIMFDAKWGCTSHKVNRATVYFSSGSTCTFFIINNTIKCCKIIKHDLLVYIFLIQSG